MLLLLLLPDELSAELEPSDEVEVDGVITGSAGGVTDTTTVGVVSVGVGSVLLVEGVLDGVSVAVEVDGEGGVLVVVEVGSDEGDVAVVGEDAGGTVTGGVAVVELLDGVGGGAVTELGAEVVESAVGVDGAGAMVNPMARDM